MGGYQTQSGEGTCNIPATLPTEVHTCPSALKSSGSSLAARASQLSHSQLILFIYTCNMAHLNAKYKINHTCEGSATTRRNSLSGRGDLLISTEHWLSKALPEDQMFTRGANNVISQHLLEYLFLGELNWDDPVLERNLFWALAPLKVSKILYSADEAGELPWDERFTNLEDVLAYIRQMVPKLPEDMQGLTTTDILASAENSSNLCTTRISAKALIGTDSTAEVAVDFKSVLADAYVDAQRNDPNGIYQSSLELALEAAGDGLSDKGIAVQAAKLTAWFRATQPETSALRMYRAWDEQDAELARRGAKGESARFLPLFEAEWDRRQRDPKGTEPVYPQIRTILVKACTGKEAARHVQVLATRARLTEGVTDATCRALCDMARGAPIAALDTAALRNASNDERCKALSDFLSSRKGQDSQAESSQVEQLLANQEFKSMVVRLESLTVVPVDYNTVVKEMAGTAIGRCYLMEGKAAAPIFKQFAAARKSTELKSALNKVLAVEDPSVQNSKSIDAIVINESVAPALLAGKYDTQRFCPWNDLCHLVISKRDGAFAADKESKTPRQSTPDGYMNTFWADYNRLELSEAIMGAAMEFIGHKGRTAGSYRSFHNGMMKRARQTENLPNDLKNKPGLIRALCLIGSNAMDYAASKDQTMLHERVEVAALPTPFFPPDSLAGLAMDTFDKDLADARREVALRDKYDQRSDDKFYGSQAQSGYVWTGNPTSWQQQGLTPWQAISWEESGEDGQYSAKKQKVERTQGSQLAKWGCHLCDHGLIFGCKFLVVLGPNVDPALLEKWSKQKECLGKMCYLRSEVRRAEWCSAQCKELHWRPDGTAEQDFVVIDLHAADNSPQHAAIATKVLAAKLAWVHVAGADNRDVIMGGVRGKSQAAPWNDGGEGTSSALVPAGLYSRTAAGRAKGGGKGGGKGKGGKGGGAGGKGGKGGRGGKGGKGGGKGGRPPFGRQRY